MRVSPSRSVRVCAVLALAGSAVTCRDDPTGPGAGRAAALAVQPVMPANLNLSAFSISVDSVRVIIIRPLTDTIADRRVAFPADSSELQLPLSVQLQQQVETLTVVLEYLGGGFTLFTGSQSMEVRAGPPGTNPPTPIAMTFVGPGASVDSLLVEPLDSVVSWGDSLRFRVLAFQGGAPVVNFYVSWTTSDTIAATVNAFGVVRAPSQRDTVYVKATTPSAAADSVLVAFMPRPSALTIISGINQSGSPGTVLPQPLRVRVIAPDLLGVPQVTVRFAATVGGGAVADSVVISDDSGFAQTTATLGASLGPNSFTATATGLPVATFQATGAAGAAVRLEFTTQPSGVAAGQPITPAVVVTARDASGNVATSFNTQVFISLLDNPGGANLSGLVGNPAVNGVATFTNLRLDRPSSGYTLLATATGQPTIASDTSALFGVVTGAPFKVRIVGGSGQGGVVGSPLSSLLGVEVTDSVNNPVVGYAGVIWSTPSGGTVTPVGPTNASGLALANWTLGPGLGTQTATATATGLSGSPLTFTALAAPLGTTRVWLGTVDTDYNNALNWSPNTLPGPSDNIFIPASVANQPVLTASAATVNRVIVETGATLDIGGFGFAVVTDVDASGAITGTTSVSMTGTGTVRGSLPNLSVTGVSTATGPVTLTGSLFVGAGGDLTVGGHTIVVAGTLNVLGDLLMQNAADTVIVNSLAQFQSEQGSGGEMTAGVLRLRGGMQQQNATGPFLNTFAPSGTHKTLLDGTSQQTVGFASPGNSFFQDVEFANAAGVLFSNGAAINGLATISAGTVGNVTGVVSLGQLADAVGGRWQVGATTIIGASVSLPDSLVTDLTFTGSHALAKDFGLVGSVIIPTGAALDLNGQRMSLTGTLTVQGHLQMHTAADTVRVGGSATFSTENGGAGDLTAGVLILEGTFSQNPAPGPFFDTYVPAGNHKTVFAGTSTQPIAFSNPGPSFFNDIEFANAAGVTFGSGAQINRAAVISAGIVTGAAGAVSVGDLADAAGGRWQVTNTTVTGTAPSLPDSMISTLDFSGTQTLAKSFTTVGGVHVPSTATLNVGGHRMVALGSLLVEGHLLMQSAADTVLVTGTASFASAGGAAGDMTAGTLVLQGGFDQQPASGPFFNTFAPSGTHTTALGGPGPQVVGFANPGPSFFHNLVIDGAGSIALTSQVTAFGQLRSPAGMTTVRGNVPMTVQGLDVDGLVFDSVTLTSVQGTLTRFDNVTFQNTDVADTAITISHPGDPTPFQLTNVTFGTTPTTGFYVAATDNLTDANTLTLNMVGALATNGPAFTVLFNGAIVNWALVEFGAFVPATPAAGVPFSVQVRVRNGAGAIDTLYNDTISVTLGANPGGSVLGGSTPRTAVAGVATFDSLTLDKIGVDYTLQATARNVGTVSSAAFTVAAGAISAAKSIVTVSSTSIGIGLIDTLFLQARDSLDNPISTGGATVVFTQSGAGAGLIGPTTDLGNGTYRAEFTGVTLGSVTIGATVNGNPVTTTLPILTVITVSTTHSADITTDETWAAAGNPHIVTAYLRVRNGATLTIDPGAQVRFDAGAGLQVGDTTLSEVGTLLMDGTASPITLTANTGTPAPGFWKGIELQRAGAATWHRVLFEWGGSPRAPMLPQPESCLLSVNTQGAAVTLDSVRFRQCVHAGIHHFGGTLTITRSVFDSATGSGLHADFQAVFSVDSSLFRGSANEGLQILSPGVKLVSATGNTFVGQGAFGVSLFGTQLHGLHRQAAIAGNGNDSIYVEAGRVDTTVTAFTIEAQPVPYLVDGLVQVGRAGAGGATVTLDSGLVMAFTSLGGLQVGDTSGTQLGQIRTRATAANPALLRNRAGGTPWRGVGLGLSAAADTLRHVRLVHGGGGGGVFGTASDANLTIYKPSGADPFFIDSVVSDSSFTDGLHIARAPVVTPRSRVVRSAFNGNTGHGLVILTAGTTPAVLDSLNSFGFNDGWPVLLSGHALGGHTAQAAFDTTGPGPNEIRVVSGQTLVVNMQPPAQLPYRMDDSVRLVQGGGGTFTLEPNLVLEFGHGAGLIIGDSAIGPAGSIASLGTGPADAPRLTSRFGSPVPGDWYGVEIGRLSGNTRLANVRIEYAGDSIAGRDQPRFGLWVRNAQPATFTLDSAVLVRNGALDLSGRVVAGLIVTGAGSGVDIRRSTVDSTFGGAGMGALVPGVRFADDSARGNDGTGMAVILPPGIQLSSSDSIAGNVITGNGGYPLEISPGALQALHLQTLLSGNARDTIAVRDSGYVTDSTRLRRYPGVPYFFDRRVIVDSGATLTIDAGDTLGFSLIAGLDIGTPANPAGLRVNGTSVLPVLMTRSLFPNAFWRGIHFRNVAPSGSFPEIRGLIVERAGFVGTCTGDCQPPLFGSIHWTSQSGENLTFDSITVRHPLTYAVNVDAASSGTVVITNSQFYDTLSFRFGPPVFRSPRGNGLDVSLSDIYRYGSTAVEASFQGIDSVMVENNYWGDGAGLYTGFPSSDSLGRGATSMNAVNFEPFATTPYFPVGAAQRIVPVLDTIIQSVSGTIMAGDTIGDPDSVRVRVVDAEGRGVNGVGVAWSQSHAGLMLPDPGVSSNGGRHAARWKLDIVATQQLAFATGVGPGVTFYADVQPDSTIASTVDWQILGPLSTADSVRLGGINADTVFASSSNHTVVLVTGARDQFGNVTQPSSGYFFADGPCGSFACRFPAADSVKGDTVYFRPPAVGTYAIRGLYDAGANGIGDAGILIAPNAAGIRIDQNAFFVGVQDTTPMVFKALCPAGGPCAFDAAERPLSAEVVDSGGAPLSNANARFRWTLTSGGAVSADSILGGAIGDTLWMQARQNGMDTLIVEDTATSSQTFGRRDTVPVLVHQLGLFLQFTPTEDTLLVGDSATFQASVLDQAFQPLANDTIHFSVLGFQQGTLTITDTSVLNQVTVRLDSTPFGSIAVTGKWGRPLADTIFGFFPNDTVFGVGLVISPAITQLTTQTTPYAVAANTVTNRVYVSHEGSDLITVIDGTSDTVLTNINALPTKYIAVNSDSDRVYVTSNTGDELRVIDGGTNSVVATLTFGTSMGGIAVDESRGLAFVPAMSGVTPMLFIVVDTGGVTAVVDSVALPSQGIEAAYLPGLDRIYVTTSDGVTGPDALIVIDAATRAVIDTVPMGDGARGIAVHNGLNRVYVVGATDAKLSIVDGATGVVLFNTFLPPVGQDRISVDEAAGRVYLSAIGGSEIAVVDALTGLQLGSVPVPTLSTDARVNPVTGRVYVTQPNFDGVAILKF